jgi:hypothetical protein
MLFSKEEACVAKSLAVEGVRILENIAHILDADALGENVFALFLNGGNAEAIGERKKLVDLFSLNPEGVRIDMLQHEHEAFKWHAGKVHYSLLFLLEIMAE